MIHHREDHPCPYIERQATTDYRLAAECSAGTYEEMLRRGWRRFGRVFFRPACASCWECRSLRVDVAAFRRNRSMQRTWQRNQDLRVTFAHPTLSVDRLQLFERYHRAQQDRRGWVHRVTDATAYFQTFVDGGGDFGHELRFQLDDRLIAVALIDVLPEAISAVYCYYDPDLSERGLGVFSVLTQLELARRREIPYLYLGYWVEPNASMRYKAHYRPHEILEGRPTDEVEPRWSPPTGGES